MKILKYIFLLILLASIGIAVYVATQKNNFKTQKEITVNIPKSIVYSYLNDYKFWEDWYFNNRMNPAQQISYSENTSGTGAYIDWTNADDQTRIQTVFNKFNDSISQKVISNKGNYNSSFKLKDTIGGTKIIWRTNGTVNFSTKISATLYGGIDKLMNIFIENNIINFKKTILREINSYKTQLDGIVQVKGRYFVKKTYKCPESKLNFNLKILIPRVGDFFKKNKIVMNGKPFVIFHNKQNDTITFSVCGPLKEEIFISKGSDVTIGLMEPFNAVKATLTGDYSHRNAVRDLAVKFINQSRINLNYGQKEMEIYTRNISDTKYPSKWVTEILIPVNAGIPTPKPVKTVTDTIQPETEESAE